MLLQENLDLLELVKAIQHSILQVLVDYSFKLDVKLSSL